MAARTATEDAATSGRIGAGTGAHTAHWRGPEFRRPGGIAYAERQSGPLVVGALCAVNAFGDIDDGTADISLDAVAALDGPFAFGEARTHTTIGATFSHVERERVSSSTGPR